MTRRTEPSDLVPLILDFVEKARPFAVVTVLQADGSTPVSGGAKAIIEADGTIHGTVGGGMVEAEAQRRACEAVRSGIPVVFDFDLRGDGVRSLSPICGGSMRLLVDPSPSRSHAEYRAAAEALARRERGLWLTVLPRRDALVKVEFVREVDLVRYQGDCDRRELLACLANEKSALVVSPAPVAREVFVEPLVPRPVLMIVGGGHVGQAVAALADLVGFEIVIIEDRPEFADPRLFPPGTKTRCGDVAGEIAAFPTGQDTFIVIVTRGHQQDGAALRACIRRPAAYLGMIGSRRKVPLIRQEFLDSGWATTEEFARVHAPIGFDIGAITVPEIAASIVAQMIAVRRKGAASRTPDVRSP